MQLFTKTMKGISTLLMLTVCNISLQAQCSTYYVDQDGDGFGSSQDQGAEYCLPVGPELSLTNSDCDDTNFNINPDAIEICNSIDDNCNGTYDEGVTTVTYYYDSDNDGYGVTDISLTTCYELGAGYSIYPGDCQDLLPLVNPGAEEICNGYDDNCDGNTDEGTTLTTYYYDQDGDGFGSMYDAGYLTCSAPGYPYVTNNLDCYDWDYSINPNATEICNGYDDNCNGHYDEGIDATTYYYDSDGDGFGNMFDGGYSTCFYPGYPYVTNNLDCVDWINTVNPNSTEICNGYDDNCNGNTDEGTTLTTYYYDYDGDGFGSMYDGGYSTCSDPGYPYVTNNLDCYDWDYSINPNATEICNGYDDNCNGNYDEGIDATTYYYDWDGDGYGNMYDGGYTTCGSPYYYNVTNNLDCNDYDYNINPTVSDYCNSIDDNCNGYVDEDAPNTAWYLDYDYDGWGVDADYILACQPMWPYNASQGGDCNDSASWISPSSGEWCNSYDDNCDGNIDEGITQMAFHPDMDNDGWGDGSITVYSCNWLSGYTTDSLDCDDTNNSIHPYNGEACNGIDDDCNGLIDDGALNYWYADNDGDNFGNSATVITTCDMFDALPGYVSIGGDCNDDDALINPLAAEILSNTIDDNCDGLTDMCPDFDFAWIKSYGKAGIDGALNVIQTNDGGFLMAGTTTGDSVTFNLDDPSTPFDFYIVKTDENGDSQWMKTYGGSGSDIARDVAQTLDGGYIVVGTTHSNDGDVTGYHMDTISGYLRSDAWIIKIDNAGNLQWQKTLGGTDEEEGNAIIQTPDGNYVVAIRAVSTDGDVAYNHGGADAWFVMLDGSGNIMGQMSYGGSGWDGITDMELTPSGNVMAVGSESSSDGDLSDFPSINYNDDIWALTLDLSGNIIAQTSIGGSSWEQARGMSPTSDGGMILIGESQSNDGDITSNHGNVDIWVVKLDATMQLQWQQTYGGSGYETGADIIETSDGGYIFDGGTKSQDGDIDFSYGGDDGWIVKISNTGAIEWQKHLGSGFQFEECSSVLEPSPNTFVVAGYISGGGIIEGNHGLIDATIAQISIPVVQTWHADADNDTYGDMNSSVDACKKPIGYLADNTDCDDTNTNIYPGAEEICNGVDDDCNGDADAGTVLASISPSGTVSACKGSGIVITANSCDECTYQWYKNGNKIVGANANEYIAQKPAYYQVQVNSPEGCFGMSDNVLLTYALNPNANIFSPNGLDLCGSAFVKLKASFSADYSYVWYKNGAIISGAHNYIYLANTPGSYYCAITNAAGCLRNTTSATVVKSCREGESESIVESNSVSLFPNPAKNQFTIDAQTNNYNASSADLYIYNTLGQIVYTSKIVLSNGSIHETIQVDESFSSGLYSISIVAENEAITTSVIITK